MTTELKGFNPQKVPNPPPLGLLALQERLDALLNKVSDIADSQLEVMSTMDQVLSVVSSSRDTPPTPKSVVVGVEPTDSDETKTSSGPSTYQVVWDSLVKSGDRDVMAAQMLIDSYGWVKFTSWSTAYKLSRIDPEVFQETLELAHMLNGNSKKAPNRTVLGAWFNVLYELKERKVYSRVRLLLTCLNGVTNRDLEDTVRNRFRLKNQSSATGVGNASAQALSEEISSRVRAVRPDIPLPISFYDTVINLRSTSRGPGYRLLADQSDEEED